LPIQEIISLKKGKKNRNQNDDLNLTHVYLAYTGKGAEIAMRDAMARTKRAKQRKKKSNKDANGGERPTTAATNTRA